MHLVLTRDQQGRGQDIDCRKEQVLKLKRLKHLIQCYQSLRIS